MENKKDQDQHDEKRGWLEPDPETLHTTDPQEHMKGPLSSKVQQVKVTVEDMGKDRPASAVKEEKENEGQD